MVRRADRLLLQVRVSFEATRLGPHQHLIEAYARLVPTVQRTRSWLERSHQPQVKVKRATARSGGKP